MNIAFVNWWTFNTVMGGIEAVGARIGLSLISRGHRVCFATVEEGYPSPKEVPSMLFPDKRSIRGRKNRDALLAFFRHQQVECIVCHNAYRHRLAILMHEVAEELGVPLLFEIHTTPDYFRYECHAARIFRPIERWHRRTKTLRQWHLIHRLADRIILLSERYVPLYRDLTGIEATDRFCSIPNPNTYDSSEIPSVMEKENILLYVGRYELRTKRVDLLLQAWSLLESDHPDWSLYIIGGGSECERSTLDEIVNKLSLKRVHFEGVQKPAPYLKRAKLLAQTSKYEGWPLVLPEAMQFGVVPVAIHSYAALGEILDEGRAGMMVESDDPEDFAQALSSLMSNEEKRSLLAEHAQEYVRQFDLEAVTDRWETLLEKVIKEKKNL